MSEFNYRFSIIPGWVVDDPRLKGRDLQVLCVLGKHVNKTDNWCRKSQVKMAAQLNISRSTVQASLNRLVEIGAVERRIVESPDGRDSAHRYRIIYDREVDSFANSAWDDDDLAVENEENDPSSEAFGTTPPADISAGGAGPESAPPASSGSAPIKDSLLRPPLNQTEREPARDGEEEEDPKTSERRFRSWWSEWPSYEVDHEANTRRAWQALTPEQRKACEERTADYLKAAKASGRKFSKSAATYLSERAWERLGDKATTGAVADTFTVYSRPGTALRLSLLSKAPVPLRLTPIEEMVIAGKPEKEEMMWRDKREKQGWPDALKLHEAGASRRKVQVPADIVALSQTFEGVEVGSAVWHAWKKLFHDRSWPWLPEPGGLEWVQFPALPSGIEDPDEAVVVALKTFQRKLIEGWGNDDAA